MSPGCFPSTSNLDGLNDLQHREVDCLLHEQELGYLERPMNISQAKRRCVRGLAEIVDCIPCATRHARIWYPQRQRLLHPVEVLRMQTSLTLEQEVALMESDNITLKDVQHLGGNAFCTVCLAVVKLAVDATLAAITFS